MWKIKQQYSYSNKQQTKHIFNHIDQNTLKKNVVFNSRVETGIWKGKYDLFWYSNSTKTNRL